VVTKVTNHVKNTHNDNNIDTNYYKFLVLVLHMANAASKFTTLQKNYSMAN